MNIKQAKEEVKHTFLAYTKKTETGEYRIPFIRQRPLLLIGPPGIGKTAVVAQAAQELQTGFVSYTMTHHTRQSAVGLPLIREKKFGEKIYSVTEYTMSEIIGSVYEKMEETGCREGILFLDEVNCVSETLAPTMLQFLQCKKFGTHSLPEGWVIVTAGNPPWYNKSVRDFDMVTLDRLKYIEITEDYRAWKEYAVSAGVHGVILSYLDLKKDAFYQVEQKASGMEFVTARGWEDLSESLAVYEELGMEITEDFLLEYLRMPETASDFKNYYELCRKYRDYYHIEEIVKGNFEKEQVERLKNAPFDEAVSVIGLFLARLQEGFERAEAQDRVTQELHQLLKAWKVSLGQTGAEALARLKSLFETRRKRVEQAENPDFQDPKEKRVIHQFCRLCQEYIGLLASSPGISAQESFSLIKEKFSGQVQARLAVVEEVKAELDHAFDFLEEAFHSSQEMVIFITELSERPEAVRFIMENGCDKFYQYNEDLLFYEKQKAFQAEIQQLKGEMAGKLFGGNL